MTLAPKLERRLDLEERIVAPDGSGGFTTTWGKLGTLPAQMQARSGRERFIGGRIVSGTGFRITVRAAPHGSPSRPRPDQRFRDGARIYAILAVTESNKNDLYLECWAEEGKYE